TPAEAPDARAVQRIRDAMPGDAGLALVDDDRLLINWLLAHVQKVRDAEHLDLARRLVRAGRDLHDGFGAELLPGGDVDRVVEAVEAGRRLAVRDHLE